MTQIENAVPRDRPERAHRASKLEDNNVGPTVVGKGKDATQYEEKPNLVTVIQQHQKQNERLPWNVPAVPFNLDSARFYDTI